MLENFERAKRKNIELKSEIEEHKNIQEELEVKAAKDPLTGLYNRRGFFQLANNELKKAHAFKYPITLILIDLDDFKYINDNFGHPIGDIVLSKTANIFQRSLRSVDIICRYGGDEFIILIPKADAPSTKKTIQRIQNKLEDSTLPDIDFQPIKFSAGIAAYSGENNSPSPNLEILLKWADEALYEAKGAGKNGIYIFNKNETVH